MNITVSSQFQDLIYPLTNEELTILEQSILTYGVRDPLVVWQNGSDYLIDGHHRWGIIKKHKITKYNITKLKFDSKHDVINWILDNQLGRRNATPEGISYLRGLRYKNEKLSPHRPTNKGEKISPLKTSERLAEQYKITSRTIYNDEKFADAIETISKTFTTPTKQKDIKHKILTRQVDLSKKDLVELSELSAKYIKQIIDGEKQLWQVKLEIEQTRKNKKKKVVRVVLPDEIKMYQGDCIDVMKKMDENTVDAALIDPPYGIGMMNKEWDNFKPSTIDKDIEQSYFVGDRSPALKAGLYDLSYEGGKKYQKWCSEWGKELLRVIKPGGHILCFCSPRMYHRLCCGLEDVGWQVRTTLMWVFGTGFPTSMAISQQIDKINGNNGKNPLNRNKNNRNVIDSIALDADEYEGYHTQIKNSFEPILLARKPLSEKTVAENVIRWGTGVLNIDGCRVGNSGGTKAVNIKKGEGRKPYNGGVSSLVEVQQIANGRFPSSVILNEEAGQELNHQAGLNVSQYFYCPKPSLTERNFGCEDLPPKKQNSTGNIRTYNDRCGRCGKKFIGSKTTICQCPVGEKITNKEVYTNANNHPTIKPVNLLDYLVKLISPPNSPTVIDCFAGSGTTGMACAQNNFKFIGIEKEKDYYQIAKRRIMAAYRDNQ